MADQLTVTTERIDDVVLLLHMMMQMGLPEVLNLHSSSSTAGSNLSCRSLGRAVKNIICSAS
ncbi:hypothetical protein HRE53_04000 [Acaryochloris sp. 'Moss Beach']|uniref:hypothetical protein n=1 Tax=Acaryochloris TaxID=155977 RepID=UPI001BB0D427|nr:MULTISPECIES: hypothetical protein [Acaryochloris]QUY45415.1 hypothetical protein I1H34_17795 [Acaryochloris marina S15]UJB72215.1 hypothetical protein HRE53_04000 [Acaryochloris sp. 'Moss Beach']